MCKLTNISRSKTRTIYKVVYSCSGKYYSIISGMRIGIGLVSKMIFVKEITFPTLYHHIFDTMNSSSWQQRWYNPRMVGLTVGYQYLQDAEKVVSEALSKNYMVILKIKLGGIIYEGVDDSGILYNDNTVYAGSEILNFKEVKSK